MILLPAIDILAGRTVRLAQGSFDARTTYDADPRDAARRWVAEGARALHLVDLDGARNGSPRNLEHIARIAQEVGVPVAVGGGLRSLAAVERAIEAGAAQVILGTAAYGDTGFLEEVIDRFAGRVVVSVDARNGRLAASGWREQTEIPLSSAIERLTARGVERFIYSSIERDGTLTGPDLDGAREAARTVSGTVVYSGGVSSLADLRALGGLGEPRLTGVIVGKALYEGRFTVTEGQAVLDAAGP